MIIKCMTMLLRDQYGNEDITDEDLDLIVHQKEPYGYNETLEDIVNKYAQTIDKVLSAKYRETNNEHYLQIRNKLLPAAFLTNFDK